MSNSDGSLDDLRERTDRPMRYLARQYGPDNLSYLVIGGVMTVLGAALFSIPAFVLGVALDTIFQQNQAFTLPLVPDVWLPDSRGGGSGSRSLSSPERS